MHGDAGTMTDASVEDFCAEGGGAGRNGETTNQMTVKVAATERNQPRGEKRGSCMRREYREWGFLYK